jgi:broad specificity phosphatase PhoE
MKKELLVIRHGQTEFNREKKIIGQTDEGLTNQGIAEARILGRYFKDHGPMPQVIFSGPLRRQTQTAEVLGDMLGVGIEVRAGLREANWGGLEGKGVEELGKVEYGYNAVGMKLVGGETPQDIEKRVQPVIDELLSEEAGCVAAVTSALTACVIVQVLEKRIRNLETARYLETGDTHQISLVTDRRIGTPIVDFKPNCLRQLLKA